MRLWYSLDLSNMCYYMGMRNACHIGIVAHTCCRSVEDTEKLRRKYLRAKRFYEEKVVQ